MREKIRGGGSGGSIGLHSTCPVVTSGHICRMPAINRSGLVLTGRGQPFVVAIRSGVKGGGPGSPILNAAGEVHSFSDESHG